MSTGVRAGGRAGGRAGVRACPLGKISNSALLHAGQRVTEGECVS